MPFFCGGLGNPKVSATFSPGVTGVSPALCPARGLVHQWSDRVHRRGGHILTVLPRRKTTKEYHAATQNRWLFYRKKKDRNNQRNPPNMWCFCVRWTWKKTNIRGSCCCCCCFFRREKKRDCDAICDGYIFGDGISGGKKNIPFSFMYFQVVGSANIPGFEAKKCRSRPRHASSCATKMCRRNRNR